MTPPVPSRFARSCDVAAARGAGCGWLPRGGGLTCARPGASDHAVQSPHHEPLCLLAAARQVSGLAPGVVARLVPGLGAGRVDDAGDVAAAGQHVADLAAE